MKNSILLSNRSWKRLHLPPNLSCILLGLSRSVVIFLPNKLRRQIDNDFNAVVQCALNVTDLARTLTMAKYWFHWNLYRTLHRKKHELHIKMNEILVRFLCTTKVYCGFGKRSQRWRPKTKRGYVDILKKISCRFTSPWSIFGRLVVCWRKLQTFLSRQFIFYKFDTFRCKVFFF